MRKNQRSDRGGAGKRGTETALTCGELAVRLSEGVAARAAAVAVLHEVACDAARSVVARGRLGGARRGTGDDPDDLAADLVATELARNFAGLSSFDPDVPVYAWCVGVVRHRVARSAQRLARERPLGAREPASRAPDERDDTERPPGSAGGGQSFRDIDLSALTQKQAGALLACSGAASFREAARRLGIDWTSFRERVRGAAKAMARHRAASSVSEGLAPGASSRAWAFEYADRLGRTRDETDATLLRLWATGATAAAIGAAVTPPMSKLAVRSRLQRRRAEARALGLLAGPVIDLR